MKENLRNFLFGRSSGIEMAIVALGLAFIALACTCGGSNNSSSKPAKPIPLAYLGDWKATDGTILTITGDGTGKYISASGNSEIKGAAVEVDEAAKTIRMTLLGFEVKKFSLDKPASGGQMTLDGVVFKNSNNTSSNDTKSDDDKKTSPFGDTSKKDDITTTKPAPTSAGDVPPISEVNDLTRRTLDDFVTAVKNDDFDAFYESTSQAFQNSVTPAKLRGTFNEFVEKKIDLTPEPGAEPNYSPQPFINKDGLLEANGSYVGINYPRINFELKYIKEAGDWKLIAVRVRF